MDGMVIKFAEEDANLRRRRDLSVLRVVSGEARVEFNLKK